MTKRRRICFVTGTRAEFGLMQTTLAAIDSHPSLQLQIIVTGMHVDSSRRRSLRAIDELGWGVDRVIPWLSAKLPADRATQTGLLTSRLARAYSEMHPDIILVVGDRVEA